MPAPTGITRTSAASSRWAAGCPGPASSRSAQPIAVDRDVVWVLDDWRLKPDASISDDFGNMLRRQPQRSRRQYSDRSTAACRKLSACALASGSGCGSSMPPTRGSSAWSSVAIAHGHRARWSAGRALMSREDGRVVLGPAMRVDLVIDMTGSARHGAPGDRRAFTAARLQAAGHRLRDELPLRERPPDTPIALAGQHDAGAGSGGAPSATRSRSAAA